MTNVSQTSTPTLSVKAFSWALALVFALGLLIIGLINRIDPNFGWWILRSAASIFPGYIAAYGLKNLVIGIIWAAIDGYTIGTLIALTYNYCTQCCQKNNT